MPPEEDKGFTVKDRRRFTTEGEVREGGEAAPAGAVSAVEDAVRSGPRGPDPEHDPLPLNTGPLPRGIDFTTFVFSLGSSALIHLGEAPNPETGQGQKDLALAQETIDLLAMLQEKTKGNLAPEEERFLGALLYDLRLRFVQASR